MLKDKTTVILISVVFFLSLFLFWQTRSFEFVQDDIHINLHQNPLLNSQDNGTDYKGIWSAPYEGMYIPVTYTIWSFFKDDSTNNKSLFKASTYHLLNVLIHSLNSILLFLFILLFFKNLSAAFWGSLIFAIHPIQVESVAYISEFRGLLCFFFGLFRFKGIWTNPYFS